MSLVNDMLTDLDSRDQIKADEYVLIDHQHSQTPVIESRKSRSLFVLLLIIAAVGIWLGIQWQAVINIQENNYRDYSVIGSAHANTNANSDILLEQGNIERTVVRTPIAEEILGIGKDVVDTKEKLNSMPKAVVVENSAAVSSNSNFNDHSIDSSLELAVNESEIDPINKLLQKAQQALSVNKLTTPSGDNAFSTYQKILYSDPNNSEARSGIRKIAERYIALADDLYLRGEWDRAQRYDNKASYVASFYPEVATWFDGIKRPSPDRQWSNNRPETGAETVAASINLSGTVTRGQSVTSITTPRSRQDVAPSLKVERSQFAQKLKIVERAKSLLKKNELHAAESVLLEGQETYPESTDINTMLFDVYLASDRNLMARQYLEKLTQLAPFETAFLESRVLVAEQKNLEAIALLEKFSPTVSQATEFYRLLAGLYQKEGRYSESAQQYRNLLSVDNRQATYWLGLAVSLDALRDTRGALQAFQSVRQFGISNRETRAYVDQRIRILSS